jgi:hypothetical protein
MWRGWTFDGYMGEAWSDSEHFFWTEVFNRDREKPWGRDYLEKNLIQLLTIGANAYGILFLCVHFNPFRGMIQEWKDAAGWGSNGLKS